MFSQIPQVQPGCGATIAQDGTEVRISGVNKVAKINIRQLLVAFRMLFGHQYPQYPPSNIYSSRWKSRKFVDHCPRLLPWLCAFPRSRLKPRLSSRPQTKFGRLMVDVPPFMVICHGYIMGIWVKWMNMDMCVYNIYIYIYIYVDYISKFLIVKALTFYQWWYFMATYWVCWWLYWWNFHDFPHVNAHFLREFLSDRHSWLPEW